MTGVQKCALQISAEACLQVILDPLCSFCALLSALPPDAARNDVVRLRPIAADAETGQIAAGVGSGSYRHKSITHCLQFAFQQARRGAMLFCWTIGVDDDHFSRHFQGRVQAPEKSIRFGTLRSETTGVSKSRSRGGR